MRVRSTVALVALTLLVAGVSAVPRTRTALADTLVTSAVGTALPVNPVPFTQAQYETADSAYLTMTDTNAPYTSDVTNQGIFRISDGSLVRHVLARDYGRPGGLSDDASGPLYVRHSDYGTPAAILAEDVETGAVRWSLPVDAYVSVQWASGSGVIAVGANNEAFLLRPGQPDLDLGTTLGTGDDGVRGDARTALLVRGNGDVTMLDVATGTMTDLGTSFPYFVRLSPHRVWVMQQVYDGAGQPMDRMTWFGRDGSAGGSVDLPPDGPETVTLGDRIVDHVQGQLVAYDDDGSSHVLVPGNVVGAVQDGQGNLLLSLNDVRDGRMALLHPDGTVQPLFGFPTVPAKASAVFLHGPQVTAAFGTSLLTTPADGSGDWSLAADHTVLVTTAGQAQLTASSDAPDVSPLQVANLTLTAPGVSRTGPIVALGRGGQLYLQKTETGLSVRAVTDGSEVRALPPVPQQVALDGPRVWLAGIDADHLTLTRWDTSGETESTNLVEPVPGCQKYGGFEVAGRWAHITCYNPNIDEVVDLDGIVAPDTLPPGQTWQISNGAVAATTYPPGVYDHSTIRVLGLGPDHAEVDLPADYDAQTRQFTFDDTGAPRLTYLDPHGQPRVYALPNTPGDDTTAPQLVSATSPPAVTTNQRMTWSWGLQDPTIAGELSTGLDAVQYRTGVVTGSGTTWALPWSWGSLNSVSLLAEAGHRYCVQVRGRDHGGLTSDWFDLPCSTYDAQAPTMTGISAGPPVQATVVPVLAHIAWAASDDVGVAGYDVLIQTAAPGKALSPATLERTAAHSLSRQVLPGGQVCLTVRARDLVGRVSAWSRKACTAVPFDDRVLRRSASGAAPVASSAALGRTLTRLTAGGSLSLTVPTFARLGLCVYAGPGQGVLDVFDGGTRIARLNLAASSWRREVLFARGAQTGTVTIRNVTGSAFLDGLTVLRV